jgi:hypothetical protein
MITAQDIVSIILGFIVVSMFVVFFAGAVRGWIVSTRENAILRALWKCGITTEASILGYERYTNGRSTFYTVRYRFSVVGVDGKHEQYEREQPLGWLHYRRLQRNHAATVEIGYLESEPTLSRLAGKDRDYREAVSSTSAAVIISVILPITIPLWLFLFYRNLVSICRKTSRT